MTSPEQAERFTAALGLVIAGAADLADWGQDNGIATALGLSAEEWRNRKLSGRVMLSRAERREAVLYLTAPVDEGGRGLTTRQAAEVLGVGKSTVATDAHPAQSRTPNGASPGAAEPTPVQLWTDETEPEPDAPEAVWSGEEEAIGAALGGDEPVVVSYRRHPNLIAWAEAHGLFVRIDRRSEWGNPFELPDDGDRATVIANYETHYLPHKPSLLERLGELRGKALGCWCAPEPCHGDVLKRWAARAREPG